ncbi:MAG: hypothetical protein EAZ88_22750 [Oscillatoriales cyanobacterium]|nr:MAG: hypothetical protein EAZ88_22750 [Oscillatoriales cyanobacterium]
MGNGRLARRKLRRWEIFLTLILAYLFDGSCSIFVDRPFLGGLEAQPLLPTRRFSLCGTGILPVLQKYSKYWMKTEQGHF